MIRPYTYRYMARKTLTLTFLFTDVEGSTRLWEEQPLEMEGLLEWHDTLMRSEIDRCSGIVFRTAGDAFYAVFEDPHQAVEAAISTQIELHEKAMEGGKRLSARMALYTGLATRRDGDYFGTALNRASRLLSMAHGGQVLISAATAELVRDRLPNEAYLIALGRRQLRDTSSPENLFQLAHPKLAGEFPPIATPEEFPSNLPRELSSFVGREDELFKIGELFERTPLLTLTGSGGCGKTRLALVLAADLTSKFPDGVWLVELASITDAGHVLGSVARCLSIRDTPGTALTETLKQFCRAKSMVLVLDNCEHLIDECARLIEDLLRHCPKLKIVCTSRESLGIAGEIAWKVPSLSLPDQETCRSVEDLMESEAAHLFVDRARTASPSFEIRQQDIAPIIQICTRLDGIPLALELAAARVPLLPVSQLASRLDDRFRILTGGNRTALPRQQTLRAAIEWSYNLLEPKEKLLLQRLSVFSGGWTLEAAEHVCSYEGLDFLEILDLISNLNSKSLVIYEEKEAGPRYGMLESLKQYARERLMESPGGTEARTRHAAFFFDLSTSAEVQLSGPEQITWLQQLDVEHSNLRTALEWTMSDKDAAEQSLRFSKSLHRFWEVRGHIYEGRQWLTKALQFEDRDANVLDARMRALNALGDLEKYAGEYDSAIERFLEALSLAELLEFTRGRAIVLNNIGLVHAQQGRLDDALLAFKESHQIALSLGSEVDAARALDNMGGVLADQGDVTTAIKHHQTARGVFESAGDKRSLSINSYFIAEAYRIAGQESLATENYLESLAQAEQVGMRLVLAGCQEGLAKLMIGPGRFEDAARLLVSGDRIRSELGEQRSPIEQSEFDHAMHTLRHKLAQNGINIEGPVLSYSETVECAAVDAV